MGTWGLALYSDDTACDIRDAYRDLLGDGHEGAAATDALLAEYREALEDPDEASVFWLALADTQWRVGRLEPRVLDRALTVIDAGLDLRRWDEAPRDREKRAKLLDELRAKLTSKAPAPKRIPKRFDAKNDWERGEVVSYELRSGRLMLFRVVGHEEDVIRMTPGTPLAPGDVIANRGCQTPHVELLDWTGAPGAHPSLDELQHVEVRRTGRCTQIMLAQLSERELPASRVRRTGWRSTPSPLQTHFVFTRWRTLDADLERWFGLR
jgi:hypothetical protein